MCDTPSSQLSASYEPVNSQASVLPDNMEFESPESSDSSPTKSEKTEFSETDTPASTPSIPERATRSQSASKVVIATARFTRSRDNPEFVAKQKTFMAQVQAANLGQPIENAAIVLRPELQQKRKRESIASPQTSKKKKLQKNESTFNNDNACWECHKEGQFICCEMCPRSFHLKCAGLEKEPDEDWACKECHAIMLADNVENRSKAMQLISVDQFGVLLKFALNRLKASPSLGPFLNAVNMTDFPTYKDIVLHPVDFQTLEKNIKRKFYGSTEAFLADAKWIPHNSILFNGANSKVSTLARSLIKMLKQELGEIETCPDCYQNAHQKPGSWFVEACRLAHPLVWARLKGFPYWPAKAVKWKEGNVDVRFFGRHDRSWIPLKDVYLYSDQMPTLLKGKNKTLENCHVEVNQYIKNLTEKFGQFQYAPQKTAFNPYDEEQIRILLPTYHGPPILKIRPVARSVSGLSGQSGTDDDTSSIASTDSVTSLNRRAKVMRDSIHRVSPERDADELSNYAEAQPAVSSLDSVDSVEAIPVPIIFPVDPTQLSEPELNGAEITETSDEMHLELDSSTEEPNKSVEEEEEEEEEEEVSENAQITFEENITHNEPMEDGEIKASEDAEIKNYEDAEITNSKDAGIKSSENVEISTSEDAELSTSEDAKIDTSEDVKITTSEDAKIDTSEDVKITTDDAKVTNSEAAEITTSEAAEITTSENVEITTSEVAEPTEHVKPLPDSVISEPESCLDDVQSIEEDISDTNDDVTDTQLSPSGSQNVESVNNNNNEESLMEIDQEEGQLSEASDDESENLMIDDTDPLAISATDLVEPTKKMEIMDENIRNLERINALLLATDEKPDACEPSEKLDAPRRTSSEDEFQGFSHKRDNQMGVRSKVLDGLVVDLKHKIDTDTKESEKMDEQFNAQLLASSSVTVGKVFQKTPEKETKHKIPDKDTHDMQSKALDLKGLAQNVFHNITITTSKRNSDPVKKASTKPAKVDEPKDTHKVMPDSLSEAVRLVKSIGNIAIKRLDNKTIEHSTGSDKVTISVSKGQHSTSPKSKKSLRNSIANLNSSISVTKASDVSKEEVKMPSGVDTTRLSPSISIIPVGSSVSPEKPKSRSVSTLSSPQSTSSVTTTAHSPIVSIPKVPATSAPMIPPPPLLSHPTSTQDPIRNFFGAQLPAHGSRTSIAPAGMRLLASNPALLMQSRLPAGIARHLPPDAGPLSAELNKHSHKLAEMMRISLEDVLSGLVSVGSAEGKAAALQLELERSNWRHQQELAEVRHNADLLLVEMRSSLEAERQRSVEEVRKQMENKVSELRRQYEHKLSDKITEAKRLAELDKQRDIEETKKKQWCANCNKEALFFCCWNTSYCDYPCQQTHWPQHMSLCGQNSSDSATASGSTGPEATNDLNGDASTHSSRVSTPVHSMTSSQSFEEEDGRHSVEDGRRRKKKREDCENSEVTLEDQITSMAQELFSQPPQLKRRRKSTPCIRRREDLELTPDQITDRMLDNVAVSSKDKFSDPVNGTSCHHCRQKTGDMKTICRSGRCIGLKGFFCGPCLKSKYGEDVKEALLDGSWECPLCRGICVCTMCSRKRRLLNNDQSPCEA